MLTATGTLPFALHQDVARTPSPPPANANANAGANSAQGNSFFLRERERLVGEIAEVRDCEKSLGFNGLHGPAPILKTRRTYLLIPDVLLRNDWVVLVNGPDPKPQQRSES